MTTKTDTEIIRQLRADLREAIDALEPFAKAASYSNYVVMGGTPQHKAIFMTEFRNAAAIFMKHRNKL